LVALVRRDVKKRYAATLLGAGWTVLQPAILLAVYVGAFGFILRSGRPDGDGAFVVYLLTGMLPFLAIADGLQRAISSLREDRALLDREAFPAEVVPASRVVTASINEIVGLLLVVAFGAIVGERVDGWLFALPVLVLIRVVLTLGLAWLLSIIAAFVSDLGEFLSLALTAWLFLTPIFYTADLVPPFLRWILVVNPLHSLIEAYRSVLIAGEPPWPAAIVAAAWAGTLFAGGLWFYRKAIDRGRDFL
jgi:lipopolysaccharide transport system permease protein